MLSICDELFLVKTTTEILNLLLFDFCQKVLVCINPKHFKKMNYCF